MLPVFSSSAVAGAKIDPALLNFTQLKTGVASQWTRVMAVTDSTRHGVKPPRRYDRQNVLAYMRYTTDLNFREISDYLQKSGSINRSIRIVNMFWVNSSLVADVSPEGLKILASAPGVTKIYQNGKIYIQPPVSRRLAPPPGWLGADGGQNTYDLDDIKINRVRAEMPDLDGRGVVLGHLDTGVDGKHPALAGKVILFYDTPNHKKTEPYDTGDHGTHTAGTMVGGNGKDVNFGMAPSAKLISATFGNSYDVMVHGMQFMLDPDGNPNTVDMPRAINNSWNCGGAPDMEPFYRAISAWEAAGILPVFSAGNAGPGDRTITPPHEHPSVIAIGATQENGLITSFSSRGPGTFRGQDTQKPDITAPGANIYSSLPGGKFGTMSGTSMAAPHVAGATGLLYQLNPKLTPEQTRKILIQSSVPRDVAGNPGSKGVWNKVYGFGKMDLYAAVQMTKQLMQSQGNAFRPMTFQFAAPEDQVIQGLMIEDDRDWTTYPAEFEGDTWIPSEDIWN